MNIFDEIIKKHKWIEFAPPLFWDGTFSNPIDKQYKISLCTTCMNRKDHLSQTLPKNIEDNKDYPNIEFVLLDYNSTDGLDDWIKSNMMDYIASGLLVYVRTEEPKGYSMAHSRNIAFKVASGDIVNNIDADNFTHKGFATYINKLANQMPEKAIFGKGKKMLRGRLGFYKEEFIKLLGGYDEGFMGYGHDDHDLLHRAWGLGFKLLWFGGDYWSAVPNHRKHQMENFDNKDWKHTEQINKIISCYNLAYKRFYANKKKHWGKATLVRNFEKELKI